VSKSTRRADDERFMARALALAALGEGCVEPNPQVGCVIVKDGQIVGEGFHERFGGPHAEVIALAHAGETARGATVYVTLEPCCHHGKTPPCTEGLIRAGVTRVVAAMNDPSPEVSGAGFAALEAAGVSWTVDILANEARRLTAPYRQLIMTGRPWVIAKWAMTLDGKIATRSGDSRWISSEASRAVVHQLRGRVDAIMIGSNTVRIDDPLLTARPADLTDIKRTATRIVVDSVASLAPTSRLVQTAADVPVLVAASDSAPQSTVDALSAQNAEVFRCSGAKHAQRLVSLLNELGRRRMTNVMVEGGSRLLGTLFEMRAIDEVHVFLAPKIVGGDSAASPIAGDGVEQLSEALSLADITIEELGGDVYVHGRVSSTEY
jgi:diaminohydroxyphosphoribosylaminopyrimidine deaminase/5-amino-6-(5-phosphoribosylamino)uracil reductase